MTFSRIFSKNLLFLSIITIVIVVVDQVTKFFAQNFLNVVCNKGIAFGFGQNLTLLIVPILLFVLWVIFQEKGKMKIIGFSLIFGGGVSNLFDRVINGCVRDFIDFGFWPSFNLADSAITIGVLLIFWSLFKNLTSS